MDVPSTRSETLDIAQRSLFADIEYFGKLYWDAELVAGIWHYCDQKGNHTAFATQKRVHLLNEPLPYRRMPR